MSLLDDLKKEAQEKSTHSAKDDSTTLQKHERNWHLLAPKMFLIKNYFKELADSLNVLKPEDFCDFSLTKNIIVKNLKKENFRVMKDDKGDGRTVSFRFDLVGERNQQIQINNMDSAEKFRTMMSENLIKFTENIESPKKIIFLVKPKFTSRFDYSADVEKAQIQLKITNFNGIWSQVVRHNPDKIDDALMDETAKYVLAKDNKFMELSGNTISEDMRKKLQERLQKDKSRKQAEQKQPDKLENTANKVFGLFKK